MASKISFWVRHSVLDQQHCPAESYLCSFILVTNISPPLCGRLCKEVEKGTFPSSFPVQNIPRQRAECKRLIFQWWQFQEMLLETNYICIFYRNYDYVQLGPNPIEDLREACEPHVGTAPHDCMSLILYWLRQLVGKSISGPFEAHSPV